MDLSRIDLNLFTVFDAIYREGGITPASKRLHLSQPAVSHSLARLRELLDDPLFERRGNDMVPTPMARSLAATIAGSLGNLERMLQRAGNFDPQSSTRSFSIAMREAHETTVLPDLVARVHREAEHINIAAVRIERRDLEEDLQSGELDIVLDVALPLSAEVRREPFNTEPLVVVARKEHPLIRGSVDLETYLSLNHILITGRRHGGGYEDVALGRLGMSRHIRVRCQQHSTASEMVSQSDMLATMTRPQARIANRHTDNQLLPFPAQIPALESFMYWHANVDADPANRWLRSLIAASSRFHFSSEGSQSDSGGM